MIISTNDNKNVKIANYKRKYYGVGRGNDYYSILEYKNYCNITTPNFILFNGNNAISLGGDSYTAILYINGQVYAYKNNGYVTTAYLSLYSTMLLLNFYTLIGVELY